MLVVKTIDQVVNTYEVPDALTGDFLRWLAQGSNSTRQYLVDKQPMMETVVHAYRDDRAVPGPGTEQTGSGTSNEGIGTK